MANLRQGSGKKAKKSKAPPDYVANIDALVCTNPCMGILQMYVNQNQWLQLNFVENSQTFTSGSKPASVTVPDSKLLTVLAVTVTLPYNFNYNGSGSGNVTFDDYGGQGSATVNGSYEIPLWNAAWNGPDPVHASACRNAPYTYYWTPALGQTILTPFAALDAYSLGAYTINVYYSQIPNFNQVSTNNLQVTGGLNNSKSGADAPLGAMNAFFEPTLGDGSEFAGTDSTTGDPLDDEQVLYPHYAGMGSDAFAFGSTQTMPNCQVELQLPFGVNPSGDADFADMVEDCFYGATQAGIGNDVPQTPIQHGLNCGQLPGTVQQANYQFIQSIAPSPNTFAYPLPNVAGNWLVVIAAGQNSAPPSISDTAGNTWTPLFTGKNNIQIWYANAKAHNTNDQGTAVTITMDWFGEALAEIALLEIAGVDTLDATVIAAGTTASITTSGVQGTPMYMLAFADFTANTNAGTVPPATLWSYLLNPDTNPDAASEAMFRLQARIVSWPNTYTYVSPPVTQGITIINAGNVALLAFKCSQPPAYPPALGNIIGDIIHKPSLQVVRNQCRAAGLFGSLLLDSQSKGSDVIGQLYEAMDAWPVWSGFQLKSIARSEVSAVGNGAVYYAPTSTGPIVNLQESDFYVENEKDPPVTVTRKAQVDVPDILSVQLPNRESQYNDIVVSQPETGYVALFGPRKDSPKMMRMFQSPAVALMYLGIQIRLNNYVRNSYEFSLNAKQKLLEAGDLITIPLASTMPNSIAPGGAAPVPYVPIPLRLLSAEEDADHGIKCTAEPFIYGCYAPLPPVAATAQGGYVPQTGGNPGSVNPPVIFEPVPRLAGGGTQTELWLVVSGGKTIPGPPIVTPNYGGCFVYVSTDGGISYNPAQPLTSSGSVVGGPTPPASNAILGNGITGEVGNGGNIAYLEWPAADSPDTVNDLYLDLTESHGSLESYSVVDEDQNTYPCYVGGGATTPLFVQQLAIEAQGASSAAGPFANANNLGNSILVAVSVYQGNPLGTVSVADSNGNAYIQICKTTFRNDFGTDSVLYVFCASLINAGANTITASVTDGAGTGGTPEAVMFCAAEFSDLAAGASILPINFAVNSIDGISYPVADFPSGAFSVIQAGGIYFAAVYDKQNETDEYVITPAFGWHQRATINGSTNSGTLAIFDAASGAASAQQIFASTVAGHPGSGSSAGFHIAALSVSAAETSSGIPYELMTYAVADLTSPNLYTLKATGGGTNHLDRGVDGAPAPGVGVAHAVGNRFAFVGPPYPGIFKMALDPSWIGQTLYFKFAAFNAFIGNVEDLTDCTVYEYMPTGLPTGGPGGGGTNPTSYTTNPASPLSNPTATTIAMAQTTVQFASNSVNYNARTFTIPTPSVPTTYYVTITDPGFTGDTGSETNLTAICQTSDALVGVAGNTYMGSIVALPAGGGTQGTPGGLPQTEFVLLINGQ